MGFKSTFALVIVLIFTIGYSSAQVKLSHAEAVRRLNGAGIPIWSSGGCSDRYNPDCTSLEQINEITVSNVIILKQASGCPVTFTGGTETGHGTGDGYTHWNGWKADLSLHSCLNNYIVTYFEYIGKRGDGADMYKSGVGNIYANEFNHWDIVFYRLS